MREAEGVGGVGGGGVSRQGKGQTQGDPEVFARQLLMPRISRRYLCLRLD